MSNPADAAAELPPVLGWTELTEVLRLSKTRLRQLEAAGALPPPIAELRMGRVWSTDHIRQWCTKENRTMHPLQDSSQTSWLADERLGAASQEHSER